MLSKFFKKQSQIVVNETVQQEVVSQDIGLRQLTTIEEQKQKHFYRKKIVINEFGKSVINLKLHHGILTPLHIVDLMEVDLPQRGNLLRAVETSLHLSLKLHKENLRQKLYRQAFNLQPGHLLCVVKDKSLNKVVSFKDYSQNLDKFLQAVNPANHRILLVRYFIPPIPDDLHQYDDVPLPPKFESALQDILNYCDLNYSIDNLTLGKWQELISSLSDFGVVLNFPNCEADKSLLSLMKEDSSNLNYRKIQVRLILKDTVEKHTIVLPLFVLLSAFFCSLPQEKNSFPYHFLFTATGDAKKRSLERGDISFFKLFNQLLDESLLPEQFNKCLSIIYNNFFRFKQEEIKDLLVQFNDKNIAGLPVAQ
ncbi:MAG: hypothetical protein GC158_01460 [Cyanobacteria bacterium RI_101]|nr:hypothetical protein [Cyanobacteria bacterium RI_101]